MTLDQDGPDGSLLNELFLQILLKYDDISHTLRLRSAVRQLYLHCHNDYCRSNVKPLNQRVGLSSDLFFAHITYAPDPFNTMDHTSHMIWSTQRHVDIDPEDEETTNQIISTMK